MFSLAALTILPGVMEEHAVNIREGVNQQLRVITESGKVVGGDGLGSLNWTKMMPFMKITTSSETEQISQKWARTIQGGSAAPAAVEGKGACERLQGAAVVPGQEPQHLRQGGGVRGGGQHSAAVQHLQVSQR